MNINWVRADATEIIKVNEDVRRRNFIEMPTFTGNLSKAFGYPITGDIAVVVPIFNSNVIRKNNTAIYSNEAYCKRVFWQAYEVLNYTQLAEHGIPYYILCTAEMREILESYRKLCQFPESAIVTIKNIDDSTYFGYTQQIALLSEFAKRWTFDSIFFMHSSVFFYQKPSHLPPFWPEIRKILRKNRDNLIIRHKFIKATEGYIPSCFDYRYLRWLYGDNIISESDFYLQLAEYTKETMPYKFPSIYSFVDFWRNPKAPHIGAGIWILSHERIVSDGFQDLINFSSRKCPIIYDEAFLSLYWQNYYGTNVTALYWPEILYWGLPEGLIGDDGKEIEKTSGYYGVSSGKSCWHPQMCQAWVNYYRKMEIS